MENDDNYTIVDAADEAAQAEGVDEVLAPPLARATRVSLMLFGAGLVVLALAGWCATLLFTGEETTKATVFWGVLTLPLSLIGALLVVFAAVVFVARDRVIGSD